jgi:hypothetical protein
MNTTARLLPIAAILSALLVWPGCSTTSTARRTPAKAPVQVTVVESSKGLELTPELLADLRRSVAKYLAEQGYGQEGEYLVKVNLTPDQPEEKGQWVVMRITNQPARTFTLLAAYPGADDFYPYDHYGYYNYGYPSYARYGYYDPLDFGWGYGGYYPPATVTPPRAHQPGDKRDPRPPGTRTRWDGNRPDNNRPDHSRPDDSRPRPSYPRNDDTRGRPRDYNPGGSGSGHGGGGSYSPPPPPAYNRPPQSYSPPPPPPPTAASERNSNTRGDPTEAR